MNKKGELYNDLHPKTSLKNTGFKDKKTALKTINLVKKRSLKYQFDVINTMYNRAKFHPHQTNDMLEAMAEYAIWLNNYNKLKSQEDKKYSWLSLNKVLEYEELAEKYNISDEGFLEMYKFVKGSKHKLQYIPIKKDNPEGMDYYSYRINFIKKRLEQMKKLKTPLFYDEGKYKGKPTKQHIILIMYGFSPVPNKI